LFADISVNNITFTLRYIPPGSFVMGSPEVEVEQKGDETQHNVTLTQGFWLGETTVSQALWQEVMDNNPSEFNADNAVSSNDMPVEKISWDDSQQFCHRLNKGTVGLALVLPTEAQWEYACRAGTTSAFNTGHKVTITQANYGGYREDTMPLRSFPPNGWGLYQMHGNVYEWCQDLFFPFDGVAAIDPVNDDDAAKSDANRVVRGGSLNCFMSNCNSASRMSLYADYSENVFGLRVAQIEPEQASVVGQYAKVKPNNYGKEP